MQERLSVVSMIHPSFGLFGACLNVAAVSAFTLQPQPVGYFRVVPTFTSFSPRPHEAKHGFVTTGYGQFRWTNPRRPRHRCSHSMLGQYSYLSSGFDALPFGRGRGWNSRFNLHRCRDFSTDASAGCKGTRDASRTVLSALKVGIDEADLDLGDESATLVDASKERKVGVGKPTGEGRAKGWEYWGYRVLLLCVAAIWGTNFPTVKFVESHTDVSDATATFVRFFIAAAAMLPFADWKKIEVLFAGMEIGIWLAAGYYAQAIGLHTSDASVCAFLCSLTVVFVPLVNTLTGKGIKLITMVAACLAITGTSFLELGGAKPSLNDLWCVVQSFGFGVSFTRIEYYLEKYPGQSLQLSVGQLISVALLTGVWCAYAAGGHMPDFSFLKDPVLSACMAYTGLVTTSLAVWMETIALEAVPAAEMSVIFSTEPLWATVVSRLALKERMGPNAVIGAGFILLACLTAQGEQILEVLGMSSSSKGDDSMDDDSMDDGSMDGDAAGDRSLDVSLEDEGESSVPTTAEAEGMSEPRVDSFRVELSEDGENEEDFGLPSLEYIQAPERRTAGVYNGRKAGQDGAVSGLEAGMGRLDRSQTSVVGQS